MSHNLESEGDAAGKYAGKGDGSRCGYDGIPVRIFKQEHADGGKQGRHDKLEGAQSEAVHPRRENRHGKDMTGDDKGGKEKPKVTDADTKSLFYAEQEEPKKRSDYAKPKPKPELYSCEESGERNEDDIERGTESRFRRCGCGNAYLMGGTCGEEEDAAE